MPFDYIDTIYVGEAVFEARDNTVCMCCGEHGIVMWYPHFGMIFGICPQCLEDAAHSLRAFQ